MPFDITATNRNIQTLIGLGKVDEVAGTFRQEMDEAAQVLKPWKDKVVKYSELYQMTQSKKHYDGLANIFVPEILRAVETVVSNLAKISFASDPWFQFVGREPTDEDAAKAETELVKYQLEENNFKIKAMDAFRQMAICGLTVRKIGWDYEEVVQKQMSLQGGIPTPVSVPTTIRDTWTFEPVDLLSFLISDINTAYYDIRKARWIGEEYYVDPAWVKERMRRGWFSDAFKDKLFASKMAETDAAQLTDRRNRSAGFSNANQSKKIHLFERWGLVRADLVHSPEELASLGLEPDSLVESVAIIANKTYILKLEANPYFHNQKPYVSCPYVPLEFQFGGIGVAQIGEKLQEELNDTRNQTMDNKTLILNNMWLKSKGSGISNKSLRVRPLGVIETNDMDGLKPLAPPVLTGVGVNIEGVIKEDLRQATGASSNLQGIAQAGVGTATESSIINRESYSRLLTVGDMAGRLLFKPALMMAESLNYQFYTSTKVIQVIGPLGVRFRKLGPNELIGHKDVIIHLSTDLDDNPGVKRQQLLQFVTILQSFPPQVIPLYWKLLDKVYQAFFPGKSLEEILPPPPGEEELFTAVEEWELVTAEYPVEPKPRPDIVEHIIELEKLMSETKFGLTPKAFQIGSNLIMGYEQIRAEMELQVEMARQSAAMSQQPSEGESKDGKSVTSKNGTKLDKGRVPNSSPHNQTTRDTNAGLRKDIGA